MHFPVFRENYYSVYFFKFPLMISENLLVFTYFLCFSFPTSLTTKYLGPMHHTMHVMDAPAIRRCFKCSHRSHRSFWSIVSCLSETPTRYRNCLARRVSSFRRFLRLQKRFVLPNTTADHKMILQLCREVVFLVKALALNVETASHSRVERNHIPLYTATVLSP